MRGRGSIRARPPGRAGTHGQEVGTAGCSGHLGRLWPGRAGSAAAGPAQQEVCAPGMEQMKKEKKKTAPGACGKEE